MKMRLLFVAPSLALFAIAAVSINYIISFGTKQSIDAAVWGQFGDYFGGILSPLFALAAFLSALWSIGIQQREARAALAQLAEQTEIARREFETLASDRLGEELLQVIRNIDSRLSNLLQTIISPPGTLPIITINHMAAEAQRVGNSFSKSNSFTNFILNANEPGTLVEAPVREIKHLVTRLREFLEHYSNHKASSYAPVLLYYADRVNQMMPMLQAVGVSEDTRRFFETVSIFHG